jgi:hypothetical protein
MSDPSTKAVGGNPYTQTPGATPRKDSRIPESWLRVNEKSDRIEATYKKICSISG